MLRFCRECDIMSGVKIAIQKKTKDDLKLISNRLGIKEAEVVDRALVLYLESVRNILDLEREFRAWDLLSDEAWVNMTKRISS